MNRLMSFDQMRVIWVVGAAKRLATLGVFGDVPLHLTSEAVDTYLELDEKRQFLFDNDKQMTECFVSIANTFSDKEINKSDMKCMVDLMLEFKNNRTELVRYALSHTTA